MYKKDRLPYLGITRIINKIECLVRLWYALFSLCLFSSIILRRDIVNNSLLVFFKDLCIHDYLVLSVIILVILFTLALIGRVVKYRCLYKACIIYESIYGKRSLIRKGDILPCSKIKRDGLEIRFGGMSMFLPNLHTFSVKDIYKTLHELHEYFDALSSAYSAYILDAERINI